MNKNLSKRMKTLAAGAAITCVLGGAATVVMLPSVAVASQGADDSAGHVRHSGDDAVGHIRHGQGADDPAGHIRHSGNDDGVGHT